MIDIANFPNAYKEVYTILGFMEFNDVKLIDQSFIDMLRSNMNKEHIFSYNPKLGFEKQKMLRETKAIFAYIYLNFWADEEQKKIIQAKYKQDILELEKKKIEQNPVGNIFENRQEKIKNEENVALIQPMKDGILKRIIMRIKKFLKSK